MSHMDTRMSWEPDKPHEECGVFGMYDLDGNDVASSIYYGLFALQHRGQAVVLPYQILLDLERLTF